MTIKSEIIQGGMGVGVSNWRLARAVSCEGQLGTVSIVEIAHILARRLQLRVDETDIRRACAAFPVQSVAERIFNRYNGHPEAPIPKTNLTPSREAQWLTILGSFVEVWLAKDGHQGQVAANMLAKVDMPMLPTLLGALWAGVDVFIIGAGLPVGIPQALDALVAGQAATYGVEMLVETPALSGQESENRRFTKTRHQATFDINTLLRYEGYTGPLPRVNRPAFIPIVSLDIAAKSLERSIDDGIDGYYIEDAAIAGGHNPGPRGKGVTEDGQPLYTEKDKANLEVFRKLDRPFWIAGGQASPEALVSARAAGAQGIACGSVFALSDESGIVPHIKDQVRRLGYLGTLPVRSSLVASPTGYPFQIAYLAETLSDERLYQERVRTCVIGNLQTPVMLLRADGKRVISYRCAAEPVADFLDKGGCLADTVGRMCLCQGLLATVGLGFPGQIPVVTLGKDLSFLHHMMKHADASYSAADVIRYLLGR